MLRKAAEDGWQDVFLTCNMKDTRYNGGSPFGMPLVAAGFLFLATGVLFIRQPAAWVLLAAGLLLALTKTGIRVDPVNRRIRFYTRFAGLITVGRWIPACDFGGIAVVPLKTVTVTHSLSNQQLAQTDCWQALYLLDKARKPSRLVKKFRNRAPADQAADTLSRQLEIPVCTLQGGKYH